MFKSANKEKKAILKGKEDGSTALSTQALQVAVIGYIELDPKAKVAKKASREASEGRIEAYVHLGGKIAVMLELNCETDFVAKSDDFIQLARDIAMHIAASNPKATKRQDVDEAALADERDIYQSQAEAAGKPAEIIEKIVEGKIDRYLSESVLYEQAFVKDPDQTIADLIAEESIIGKSGEIVLILRKTLTGGDDCLAGRAHFFERGCKGL